MVESETYLRTQQVADALGVGVSTVKRWVDAGSIEATRTEGRHRLVLLSSALRFARRRRFPVAGLLSLSGPSEAAPVALDDTSRDRLVELLHRGEGREAVELIASACRSMGPAALGDDLIRPVLERIGHGWMVGSWDIYEEHQATQIVTEALIGLIRRASVAPGAGRPLAIGAAVAGDTYTLPGLLGELVLRDVGWEVRNLGVDLPLRSLAAATRDYRPGLAFLTVGHLADRSRFLHEYSFFYEAASRAGTAIILGGRALDPDLRSRLVYASFGDRMAHLAEFARRLLPAPGGPPPAPTNQPERPTTRTD